MNAIDQLWAVAQRRGPIDARRLLDALAAAGETDVAQADARTRMLVQDAADALRDFLGRDRFRRDAAARARPDLADLPPLPAGSRHFCLKGAIVDATDPGSMYALLRELGDRVRTPSTITIGGSLALMVDELIVRHTSDIDVVDALPDAIRDEHDLLHRLAERYRLHFGHFQSHYLPSGWQRRVRSLGMFGSITAYRVDPIDVLVCKLFSRREKDFDDVRLALPLVDRQSFIDRVAMATGPWRTIPAMHEVAKSNWYVLTGEADLPPAR